MSQQEEPPSPAPTPPPSPHYASPFTTSSTRKKTKYEERDYEEIYYHFEDYSQEIILSNASKFMTPPEPAEHYEWEEVILDEVSEPEWQGMKKSMFFGMGCGLLSFGLLRWRRVGRSGGSAFGGLSKYASSSSTTSSSSRSSSTGGYTFDKLPSNNNTMHQYNQHQHHQYSNSNSNSRSGLLIDVTLTSIIAFGTSLLALESDAFYPTTTVATSNNGNNNVVDNKKTVALPPPPQWISPNIPLVPGRSIVAETLCGPLTDEFRKFPKQLWQSGNHRGIENEYNNHMALYANSGWKGTKYYGGNDNASVVSLGENGDKMDGDNNQQQQGMYERLVLDSLQEFVINCERRARHEHKLRKIRGLREGSPVVIPDGGVMANEDLELDDIYLIDEGNDDDDDREDDDESFEI